MSIKIAFPYDFLSQMRFIFRVNYHDCLQVSMKMISYSFTVMRFIFRVNYHMSIKIAFP